MAQAGLAGSLRVSRLPMPMVPTATRAQGLAVEAARAAVLASHAAAGLAWQRDKSAARVLRAAEALCRSAVAVLSAPVPTEPEPTAVAQATSPRRRRRRGRKGAGKHGVAQHADGGDDKREEVVDVNMGDGNIPAVAGGARSVSDAGGSGGVGVGDARCAAAEAAAHVAGPVQGLDLSGYSSPAHPGAAAGETGSATSGTAGDVASSLGTPGGMRSVEGDNGLVAAALAAAARGDHQAQLELILKIFPEARALVHR